MAVVIYPSCDETVAHLPGVRLAVSAKAEEGAARARAILGAHRKTGKSSIDVTHGELDSFVNLNDPGGDAMSIEFGRTGARGHGRSQGVHALGGAF